MHKTTWAKRLAAAAVLSLLPALLAGALYGQIEVKQGKPTPPSHKFHSPMILTMPLPAVTIKLPPSNSIPVNEDISTYTCDDVFIESLSLQLKHITFHRKEIGLELSGNVVVPKSYDRLVDLTFTVKDGKAELGTSTAQNLDAEERKSTNFRTTVIVKRKDLESAFSHKPGPELEIKMVVQDNSW